MIFTFSGLTQNLFFPSSYDDNKKEQSQQHKGSSPSTGGMLHGDSWFAVDLAPQTNKRDD